MNRRGTKNAVTENLNNRHIYGNRQNAFHYITDICLLNWLFYTIYTLNFIANVEVCIVLHPVGFSVGNISYNNTY